MKRAGIVFFCCHVALSGLGEVRKPRQQCFRFLGIIVKSPVVISVFGLNRCTRSQAVSGASPQPSVLTVWSPLAMLQSLPSVTKYKGFYLQSRVSVRQFRV